MMEYKKGTLLASIGTGAMMAAMPAGAQLPPPDPVEDYYIGQMIEMAGPCPARWMEADGRLLQKASYTQLFSLIDKTYGGDGVTTFAIPDVRGRLVVGAGWGPGLANIPLGMTGGTESQVLTIEQLATHSHQALIRSVDGDTDSPRSFRNAFGKTSGPEYSTTIAFDGNLHPDTLTVQKTGGSDPVSTLSPFTVNRFCITAWGVYPPRN
ncbi:MAG: tail fiber protein [Sphingopyxis sp.]|nr:tail fiber protein [Sphingopyxis sp.]